jgi:hypothetical protein
MVARPRRQPAAGGDRHLQPGPDFASMIALSVEVISRRAP